MKPSAKPSRPSLLCLSFSLLFFFAAEGIHAQRYYYVVIGSYADEGHAEKYLGYVRSKKFDAQKMLSENKKLHYVYVLKTTNREDAILQTKRLQQESEFKDTWLYSGTLGAVVSEDTEKKDVEEIKQPLVEETVPPIVAQEAVPEEAVSSLPSHPETPELEIKPKGKLLRFTVQTPEGEPIPLGEIHEIDYKRGRDLATFTANSYNDIVKTPANDQLTLVCAIFGYKEVVKSVDYSDPSSAAGATKDDRGAWTIPFTMERMKKGDASVMYHVTFYKDAVVMLPGSKMELDELVNMMKMNPNYVIKIHGHSNGNNKRKIIDLGKTKNYFNVAGSEQHEGSSKELSRLRAVAVQQYLTDNGIDPKRSSVFAWGGLNMLVPENSNSAKLNDRIEIEIIKD